MPFTCSLQRLVGLFTISAMAAGCGDQPITSAAPQAADVHARVLTLDTHVDTPLFLMRPGFDFLARHDPLREMSQVDWPRIREGKLDAAFWAVYVPQGEVSDKGLRDAATQADRIFARIHQFVDKYPDKVALVTTAPEVRATVARGKHAVLIGVENGFALGGDVQRVWQFHDWGARYIGLIHSRNNDLGDSSTDADGPLHGGLSERGRQVVREMNRAGIMVDVSHASDATFWDMLEVSSTPPIASHSSARAVYDHPRNMTDDMLRAIARRGGVVQVNTLSSYIAELKNSPERQAALDEMRAELRAGATASAGGAMERFWLAMGAVNARFPPPLATLADVADHIDHMVAVMGIDHVGVGADFDGGGGVSGMYDVSEIGNLTAELLNRGYSEADIGKIWSGNLLRVLAQVESEAEPIAAAARQAPSR
jgi:membrane dipeptidase